MKTNIQEKFLEWLDLDSEAKVLEDKAKELNHKKNNIFLSKFKTNSKWLNASCIFDVFLKNPEDLFFKMEVISCLESSKYGMYWSTESLHQQTSTILKTLVEEGFLKLTNKVYKLNPKIKNIIKEYGD